MAEEKESFWKTTTGLITAVAALLTAIAALIGVVAVKRSNNSPTDSQKIVTTQAAAPQTTAAPAVAQATLAPAPSTYPQNIQDTVVNECLSTGGTPSSCNCKLEAIERTVSLSAFEQADAEVRTTGRISNPATADAILAAANSC